MKPKTIIIHSVLFLFTFLTCTIAGTQWAFKDFTDASNWQYGIEYAVLILTFLSAHEFGHYFASKIHKVDATLPYYIPMPIPYLINFGTFGAVIKTRSPIPSRKALFDIGAAGPLAGFVVAFIFLIYGLITLPGIEYIYSLHPEYVQYYGGQIPDISLHFGDTLLFAVMAKLFANPQGFLPPMNEIYHYPFLCVGWFGLFVTSLNMLPLGQLDGGHVTFAMFGNFQGKIARIMWWLMIIIGLGGFLGFLYDLFSMDYPNRFYIILQNLFDPPLLWLKIHTPIIYSGWVGWLFWAFITRVLIKLDHPPVMDEEKLDGKRMFFGWLCIIILILSFSFNGIYFVE